MVGISPRDQSALAQSKSPTILSQEIPKASPPLPQSVKPSRSAKRPRDIQVNLSQREEPVTATVVVEASEKVKEKEGGILSPSFPPLGKFASKVKLMLRRKNTSEKKKEKKKREWEEVDRLEDVHWTEM